MAPTTEAAWPELDGARLAPTRESVHRWTQVVGKVKLGLCPYLNQWWEVALTPTARGLTTGLVPWRGESFEVDFDFIAHRLVVRTTAGDERTLPLRLQPVADFYAGVLGLLADLGIEVEIWPRAQEMGETAPLDADTEHAAYDPEAIHAWWRAVVAVERVMQRFRTPFHGKSSPVVLFWGAFDLAHQRFTGRPAPQREDVGPILEFGEDQENFAIGFWAGTGEAPRPLLYAYVVPKPDGLERAPVRPAAARWDDTLAEFVLPYDELRRSASPDADLLGFFERSYEASADLGGYLGAALVDAVPDLPGPAGAP